MQKKYKHLFFDLDRTLWDFEKSSLEAIKEMYEAHKLNNLGIQGWQEFYHQYEIHNGKLWDMYRKGEIEKEVLIWKRFANTLEEYGIQDEALARTLGKDYVYISPRKVNLYPNALETLGYLNHSYQMHIITNGFEEVQHIKLKYSGLGRYFITLITSEKAGFKKPYPQIFEYALQQTGAGKKESLMIGDDYEVDILGAAKIGMDQVFFDPGQQLPANGSTFKISDLIELKAFL